MCLSTPGFVAFLQGVSPFLPGVTWVRHQGNFSKHSANEIYCLNCILVFWKSEVLVWLEQAAISLHFTARHIVFGCVCTVTKKIWIYNSPCNKMNWCMQWCSYINISNILKGLFPTPCRIHVTSNWGRSEVDLFSISKVFLMNCLVSVCGHFLEPGLPEVLKALSDLHPVLQLSVNVCYRNLPYSRDFS